MPSLPEAVESKYGSSCFERPIMDVGCYAINPKGNTNGFHRLSSILILSDCEIEEAGDDAELRQQCDGVTDLDLSKNKFKCWEEVFKILQFVPSLKFLNLSFNTFANFVTVPTYGSLVYLVQLVLNGTHLTWNDVYTMLDLAPKVEELYLCLNDYSSIEKAAQKYHSIKKMHFNGNPIKDWKQVEHIGLNFPNLEVLVLADCPIESLDSKSLYATLFPNLKHISLNNSKLSSWESVEIINKFPKLSELRLQQCPLFELYDPVDRRKFTIARLEQVQLLNGGGVISLEERENAERSFIRHYHDSEIAPRRYFDLLKIHGHLDPLVNISLKPPKSVDVTIKCGSQQFKRRLNVYLKVQQVKKAMESRVGISCSNMRFFYVAMENQDVSYYAPEEIKINTKQLYTLNVQNGDVFIIDKKGS